ncbi:c-type cytochrome [Tropicimonas sp.]|uniref:c-type cytochrome n=1 Tax=Tropicimonas sp. TaxID=2067044 RepID=UPI003A8619E8
MKARLTSLIAVTAAVLALPALAEGDAAAGEKVFNKCKACHAVGEGAKNKVGPELNGIVGKAAGTREGFKYSDDLVGLAEGGLIWDDANLHTYLTNPKDLIPKGKMSFAGLKKEEDINNVIAYLQTFPDM